MSHALRQGRLIDALEADGLEALVVSDLANVRYLTGYVGTNAAALIARDRRLLITDGRYAAAARATVQGADVRIGERDLLGDLGEALRELGPQAAAGFEADTMSVARHRRLEERAGRALQPTEGLVAALRAVKDADEVELIREAAGIADRALARILAGPLVGRTEREVAFHLHAALRDEGAEDPSFPIIVASGPRGAHPHALPAAEPIPEDTLVVIDLGAAHRGYCSDMTRTVATGDPPPELERAYAVCLDAQESALAAVRAGAAAVEVDAVARKAIAADGFGDAFPHGLGHGVGLAVHERPGLRPTSTDMLAAGMVVTVEPGIYLEGIGGVRIEDLVLVTDDGPEILSGAPKQLIGKDGVAA